MCRLTLVWTLAKLPQSYWNADSIFFHWSGPSLMPTRLSTPVSGVDCLSRHPSPTAHFSVRLSHSLTGVPSPLPVTSRSRVQNNLSGFVPKQTKESSAWWTTYIVLHLYRFVLNVLFVWVVSLLSYRLQFFTSFASSASIKNIYQIYNKMGDQKYPLTKQHVPLHYVSYTQENK